VLHGNRWAGAFITTFGDKAGEGFLCLKALVEPLKAVSDVLFGYSAAHRLEVILRDAIDVQNEEKNLPRSTRRNTEEEEKDIKTPCNSKLSVGQQSSVVKNSCEYAIRFICLLVEKNQFRNIDMILQKIEEALDAKNGILSVSVESASPLDDVFEGELRRRIIAQTGAADLKMNTLVVPSLLGGYRLRIGGYYVDASLKGQIEKMKADLEAGI
jgi:ATP synthase F1 delta subunit